MNNLAKVRESIGITQHQLAMQLGCRQSRISNYEVGNRMTSLANARKITDALNQLGASVTLDDVFPINN